MKKGNGLTFPQSYDMRGNGHNLLQQGPGEDNDMDSELILQADGDTLTAAGDIDLYHATDFRHRAEKHIEEVEHPRLDLLRVPFIDSAGLAALLSLSRAAKARGKALRIAVSGSPRRVLRITGIDRLLEIEE